MSLDITWQIAAWLIFSVVLGLVHMFVGILVWHMHKRPGNLQSLFQNGSLLFFAAPLASGVYGECYIEQSFAGHPGIALMLGSAMGFIVFASVVIYSSIVTHVLISSRARPRVRIDPPTVYYFSRWLAMIAVIYGFALKAFFRTGS